MGFPLPPLPYQQQQPSPSMMMTMNATPALQDDQASNNALVMTALCLAANSNKEGASCLEQGNVPQAYDYFKSALEILNGVELNLLLQSAAQQQQQQQQQQMTQAQAPWCCSSLLGQQAQAQPLLQQLQYHQQQHAYPQQSQQQQQCCYQSYSRPVPQQQQVQEKDLLQQYALLSQHTEALESMEPPPRHFQPASASTTRRTGFEKSAFFVYQKAFVFEYAAANSHNTASSIIQEETLAVYKAQVMFNLALTLHQGGRCVDERSVYKALSLYDMCLEFTMKRDITGNHDTAADSGSGSPSSLMLTVACLNNKAHIFHEFCEASSLTIVLDTLFLAMAFLPRDMNPKESKHIQGILFNVYMLRDLCCARAA